MHEALTIGGYARPGVRSAAAERGFHIASLDGIRALAALTVFVGHAGLGHIVPGGFGVTVFFFLSGYLITTLLRQEWEQTGTISLRKFYLRRVYRIFPPLYLVLFLLMGLGLAGVTPESMQPQAVLAQLAHLTNYYLIANGPGPAPVVPHTIPMWSLAVEEHFYLLFPLALLLLLRRRAYGGVALALLAVCAVVLAWRIALLGLLADPTHYNYHATDTRLDSLLYGCIMAMWLNPALDKAPAALGPRAWAALAVAAVGLLLFTFLYRDPGFRDTLRYSLQGIALFPLFYVAVRFHRLPLFAWLDSRPMRGLGVISYTFYLAHDACLELSRAYLAGGPWVHALAGFALTVAFATAVYFLVERRFAALRRRLHG